MHILIIPSWYKSADEPMLGSFFEEQARALKKLGHQTGIIYPDYHPPSALFSKMTPLQPFIDDNGLPTYSLNVRTFLPRMRNTNYKVHGMVANRLFNKYVANHGMPDILHAHSCNHAGIAAAYIAHKHKLPLIITEHLTTLVSHSIVHETDYKITRQLFKNADKSLAVSTIFKNNLVSALQLHPQYFDVLHNMVSDLFFNSFAEKKYDHKEPFILFTNSFLAKRKNHTLLFDALKILIDQGMCIQLHIGGYGSEEPHLKKYVTEKGLQNHVVFLGMLQRHEVKQHLDNCHAFVFASTYETFGVVLIEALACGRPIITTDSKGPRDIVTPDNGLLLQDFLPQTFANAVKQMMYGYEKYNQQKITRQCHAHFSEEKIAGSLIDIYNQAIQFPRFQYPQKEKKNLLLTFNYNFETNDIINRKITLTETVAQLLHLLEIHKTKAVFFVDVIWLYKLQQGFVSDTKNIFHNFVHQLQQLVTCGHEVLPLINFDTNQEKVQSNYAIPLSVFESGLHLLKSILNNNDMDGFRIQSNIPFVEIKTMLIRHGLTVNFEMAQHKNFKSSTQKINDVNSRCAYAFEDDSNSENYKGRFIQLTHTQVTVFNKHFLRNITHKIKTTLGNSKSKTDSIKLFSSISAFSPNTLPSFNKHFEEHYYMHFASDVAAITPTSFACLSDFLKQAYSKYDIESDYSKMILSI